MNFIEDSVVIKRIIQGISFFKQHYIFIFFLSSGNLHPLHRSTKKEKKENRIALIYSV